MISDGYFVDCHYPEYIDETPNDQSLEKALKGKVEFDLGEVSHPSFGVVRIKGEFPRIRPRKERENVTEEELSNLKTRLTAWVDLFFDRQGQPEYFADLIHSCAQFTAYINPFHHIDSERMDLALKTYFWLWHTDDVLELAIEKNVPFKIVEKGFNQFLAVLKNNERTYEEVAGCIGFQALFDSLVNLQEMHLKLIPCYNALSGPYRFFLRRYFEAMRLFSFERIEKEYSEETFRYWRRLIAYFDGIAEVLFLLHGVNLPPKILKSVSLRRILDISNSMGGFINDLLGIKKELKYGQKDNYIMFKVFQKGIPIEDAVAQVCDMIKHELTDYLLLRDAILLEFSNDQSLVTYIDILESMMDGHNQIYA